MKSNDSCRLAWSLVIPTYNRQDMLMRCLALAAGQTRPPTQIIVIDASQDWESSRNLVESKLMSLHSEIEWIYQQAAVRSSSAQRNQGIAAAVTDVVFLIDDDSLMYPDCAEKIMQVYEADVGHGLVGVSAIHVPSPPDANDTADPEYGTTKSYGSLARFWRKVLNADDLFVPYDIEWRDRPIPETVSHLPIVRWRTAAGWGMTFRRDICLQEPFDEVLLYYAAGEDSDMSYRATRHGAYVGRLDARLCHIGARSGRLPTTTLSSLKALNTLVLNRIYATDPQRNRGLERRLMARRALIALLKDLRGRRYSLPEARGWLRGLRMVDRVFDRDETELRAWYPTFQQELLSKM